MKEKQEAQQTKIAHEIKDKTGFILEHDVATIFEAHDWTIIHNRYYLVCSGISILQKGIYKRCYVDCRNKQRIPTFVPVS